MKIGLVGWGIETKSAYKYFGPKHEYLIVSEQPEESFPPQSDIVKVQFLENKRAPGVTGNVEDLSYLESLENCDKIIYSVTAYKNLRKHFGDDKSFWSKATTTQHLFFENVKTKNLIGVTGTKGKGTTSSLIHQMLAAASKKAFLAGNIGVSMLDLVSGVGPEDWVVLEMSSFQLSNFPYSPKIAVCLMIVPEHLDWHANMSEYVEAKSNLFAHQSDADIAIYFPQNEYSVEAASHSRGKKLPYYQTPGARVRPDGMIVIGEPEIEIVHKSEVKLLGEHNLQNICAAATAFWQVEPDADAVKKVITTFTGLEHRLEFVREIDGVSYYDDSFGTTPETAVVAMQAFSQPKIMILGGSDKGIPFDGLADAVTKTGVRHAIVIGDTAPSIVSLLKERGFTEITEDLTTMPQIVSAARQKASSGDVVLLSAGCASFGLFKDYKDRGNQFKEAVKSLS